VSSRQFVKRIVDGRVLGLFGRDWTITRPPHSGQGKAGVAGPLRHLPSIESQHRSRARKRPTVVAPSACHRERWRVGASHNQIPMRVPAHPTTTPAKRIRRRSGKPRPVRRTNGRTDDRRTSGFHSTAAHVILSKVPADREPDSLERHLPKGGQWSHLLRTPITCWCTRCLYATPELLPGCTRILTNPTAQERGGTGLWRDPRFRRPISAGNAAAAKRDWRSRPVPVPGETAGTSYPQPARPC
jgi:hypothetical protein